MKNDVTIVTRVRNRNHILKDTLSNWSQFNVPIIVVDFRDDGCESAWEVAEGNDLVRVIETKYEYMFLPNHAWNLGLSQVQTDFVLVIDVDDVITPDFFAINRLDDASVFFTGCDFTDSTRTGLYGVLYINTKHICDIGGYNENLIYMGYGDIDLCNRLKESGLRSQVIDKKTMQHKRHAPNLTMKNQIVGFDDSKREVRRLACSFNTQLAKLVSWDGSNVTQWSLFELQRNRLVSVRLRGDYEPSV